MRTLKISAIVSTATLLLLACSSADPTSTQTEVGNTAAEDRAPNPEDGDLAPTGRGHYVREQSVERMARTARPRRGNGISYHGGPLITSGPTIHYIWYGTWSSGDKSILGTLASGLGGSPYFNINTTYTNGSGTAVANHVGHAADATDNYSRGKALADADILAIVTAQNPTDTNGVYFVMTASDVNETSGFCTQYCGWHDHATIGGRDIKYAFVGNPARCPSACTNGTAPPNGSVGADGAASIVSHELEEATTDPDLNAWYDSQGEENADKCAWTFGTTYSSGGGVANMNLGGKDFLIQQNWVNASGGHCAKSYP
jgi:hypothetical protein